MPKYEIIFKMVKAVYRILQSLFPNPECVCVVQILIIQACQSPQCTGREEMFVAAMC